MALTATVTKIWPQMALQTGDYTFGVHVALMDNGELKREQDFTDRRSKTEALGDVSGITANMLVQINDWIDCYRKEKAANNHASYELVRAGVEAGLALE